MKIYDCLKVSIVPLAAGVALFGTNFAPEQKQVMAPDAALEPAPLITHARSTPTDALPPASPDAPTSVANAALSSNSLASSRVSAIASPSPTPKPSPVSPSVRNPQTAPPPVAAAPSPTPVTARPVSPARVASPAAPAPSTPAPVENNAPSLPPLVTFEPLPTTAPTLIAQASPVAPRSETAPSPALPPSQPTANRAATTQVTLFTIDNQCNDFRQTQITVPADKAIEAAIAKVLEDRESGDFSLGGYRVSVNNGVATVDLRPAPHSERSLYSLTHCEQLALFGGVRRTLLGNAQWRIQDVQFTIAGEELYF